MIKLSENQTYLVHEIFYTFQGEGTFTGVASDFVRLWGCPLKCPWCDSAGTWHPVYKPDRADMEMSVEQIVKRLKSPNKTVVITGGEPTIWNLEPLCSTLNSLGYGIMLETSGAFTIDEPDLFAHIVVSPKMNKLPLQESLEYADDIKLIIDTEDALAFWLGFLSQFNLPDVKAVWLHPEWSQRRNPKILAQIVQAVKDQVTPNVRAGWQIHKLYAADTLDKGSRKPVPLGGNPNLGY
jgi:organic radical activating enzyme